MDNPCHPVTHPGNVVLGSQSCPHQTVFQSHRIFCSLSSTMVPHLCSGCVSFLNHSPEYPDFLPWHSQVTLL